MSTASNPNPTTTPVQSNPNPANPNPANPNPANPNPANPVNPKPSRREKLKASWERVKKFLSENRVTKWVEDHVWFSILLVALFAALLASGYAFTLFNVFATNAPGVASKMGIAFFWVVLVGAALLIVKFIWRKDDNAAIRRVIRNVAEVLAILTAVYLFVSALDSKVVDVEGRKPVVQAPANPTTPGNPTPAALEAFQGVDPVTAAAIGSADDKASWYAFIGYQKEKGVTQTVKIGSWDEFRKAYAAWNSPKADPASAEVLSRKDSLIKTLGLVKSPSGDWEGTDGSSRENKANFDKAFNS